MSTDIEKKKEVRKEGRKEGRKEERCKESAKFKDTRLCDKGDAERIIRAKHTHVHTYRKRKG